MIDSLSMRIALPNGLLFVRDSRVKEFPDIDDESASFWSIPTCVMIQGLVDSDGETDITIGAVNQVSQGGRPVFDRMLDTPSRKLIFEIVPGETVHEVSVPTSKTRIRIWADGRHQCAETLVIGLG
jgi:hypothetical protein